MVDSSSTSSKSGTKGGGNAAAAPPAATKFTPAEPLTNAGVESKSAGSTGGNADSRPAGVSQLLRDGAQKLTGDATDRVRGYAEDGKARAGTALDELVKMMTDAAGTVDEKLGEQYGQYARSAAQTVSGFSDSLKAKDLDELIEDARGFVQKSPAIAIGTAAALGFVLVRLIKSGLDSDGRSDT